MTGFLFDQAARYVNLGKAQEIKGQQQDALQSYLIATLLHSLNVAPQDAPTWLHLGLSLSQAGQHAEAQDAFRAAVLANPQFAEAYNNLGVSLYGNEAITLLQRAIAMAPGRADFHSNLAHALLSAGRFIEGFAEWEWRTVSPARHFKQPRWTNQALASRTLLVHAEQGFGDTLQFCRYLPLAAAAGARILVETRPPLAGLLSRIEGVADIIPWGAPLPAFDYHLPLPSLATHFYGQPIAVPYLTVDPDRDDLWRNRLAGHVSDKRPTVGLVWAGNPRGPYPDRTVPWSDLRTLPDRLPHYRFVGLQRDAPALLPGGISNFGPMIDNFDDLAALMNAVDLVISIDTAAAHLAGALGKRLCVLLRPDTDWRWWGPTDTNCHWYETARLYRRTTGEGWPSLLGRLAIDLHREATPA